MELMERGYPREEAYRKVQREERERERARALEAEEARQAVALGAASAAAPADSGADAKARLQQQLLRRFAEEARDAGLAYPKRWFAADGSWIGIKKSAPASGAATVQEALSPGLRRTRRSRALLDDVDIAAVSEAAAAEPTDATKAVPDADDDGNPPKNWGSC